MNIYGIGIDIVEIDRIKDAIKKNEKFLDRVFTKEEITYFKSKNLNSNTIAGNFAAKEAIVYGSKNIFKDIAIKKVPKVIIANTYT